jgi:uncharacterized protein YPO0396
MHNKSVLITGAIPEEYRGIAERLFEPASDQETVEAFADALGIGADYRRFLALTDAEEMHRRLAHFQSNLALLIQKTWVEKADENRKENLQDEVPDFITKIERGDYQNALKDFNNILDELSYLFFGAQSRRDDFTEYVFRIDAQMGLFWWYGNKLISFQKTDAEYLKSLLTLGVCYLTNF